MSYGMPYMGSKQDIVASLALNFPKAENFYDLFGGGGSVSHYMATQKKYKTVHYNEIEKTTAELLKQAINGDFSYDKFKPKWISRKEFHSQKASDAYIRLIWSFGNNQKNYLFSEDIEPYKRSLHQAIVFDDFDETAIKVLGLKIWPDSVNTITLRRLYARQKVAFNNKGMKRGDLQQLEQLEQLERLEQLVRLEQIELKVTALDYREVSLLPNSVIYCDIPYFNTGKKIHENKHGYLTPFSHNEFFEWASACPYPVFFSEYKCEDSRFDCVYKINKSVKSSPKGITKTHAEKNIECLFWNRKALTP